MARLRDTFRRLRQSGRRALIPFIMGGDPDLGSTPELLLALQDAGADVIEVGIPFSDPLADGPVIQAASARALARGATPARILVAVDRIRPKLRVPLVCLSYWNPLLQFSRPAASASSGSALGPGAFLRAAQASGIDGLIVPDLPTEESGLLRQAADGSGVATIFLAAPTSSARRLRAIAQASEGFIYYVSVTGTTGARRALPSMLVKGLRQLRLVTTKPVCVGFGISTPAQAATVARVADGVIVGSALIQAMAQARGRAGARQAAVTFVRRLRQAVS